MQTFDSRNIALAGTTVVKPDQGFLHNLVVNTTAAGTITLYDNSEASGTKIATLKASVGEGTYSYDVKFVNGLTVVTAADSDITISFT